jgi:hypothetical protein
MPAHGSSANGNGTKALIRAIAVGVAAAVEQVLTELIDRVVAWAKARSAKRVG